VRGARGKHRIARVGVALGVDARRAPSPPPSRRRRRGRALLPPRPRAHAQRLGAGGGSGCTPQGASPHPPPMRLGVEGCRRCGAGGHQGGLHRRPSRAHSRKVDGGTRRPGRRSRAVGGRVERDPNPAETTTARPRSATAPNNGRPFKTCHATTTHTSPRLPPVINVRPDARTRAQTAKTAASRRRNTTSQLAAGLDARTDSTTQTATHSSPTRPPVCKLRTDTSRRAPRARLWPTTVEIRHHGR